MPSPQKLLSSTLAALMVIGTFSVLSVVASEDGDDTRIVWMPFKRGYWAKCARSPKAGHGWIFNLSEGPPVVAAAEGRVFQVNHPQGIYIDHGDGQFGAYTINGLWEPEVQPGDLIPAGTILADIDTRGNRKGRGAPFLNFSMRGPSIKRTHPLLFRLAGSKKGVEINKQTKYLSGTRKGTASQGSHRDSTFQGNEFRANGIRLTSANHLFWITTDMDTIYEGKVIDPGVEFVVFHVWAKSEEGKHVLAYNTRVKPSADGSFVLKAHVPSKVRGSCSYRLAVRLAKGGVKGPVTILAGAGPIPPDMVGSIPDA